MASAWGNSWGSTWGNSWGILGQSRSHRQWTRQDLDAIRPKEEIKLIAVRESIKIKIEEIVEQTITESSFKFKAKQDKLKIAQELLKQLELEGLIWKELYTILIAKEYALQKKEIARKQTEEMVVVMFLSF